MNSMQAETLSPQVKQLQTEVVGLQAEIEALKSSSVDRCHRKKQIQKEASLLARVCGVAIVIFCAYKEPKLTAVWTAVGFAAEILQENVLRSPRKQERVCGDGCSGIGNLIAARALKPLETILGATYLFYLHLNHEMKPHLPVVGYFAGIGLYHHARDLYTWAWASRSSAEAL